MSDQRSEAEKAILVEEYNNMDASIARPTIAWYHERLVALQHENATLKAKVEELEREMKELDRAWLDKMVDEVGERESQKQSLLNLVDEMFQSYKPDAIDGSNVFYNSSVTGEKFTIWQQKKEELK